MSIRKDCPWIELLLVAIKIAVGGAFITVAGMSFIVGYVFGDHTMRQIVPITESVKLFGLGLLIMPHRRL